MSYQTSTYTLFRGVPYSGLDLDDLEGKGGYGHQMLGAGLYTTDEYNVASDYAQGDEACVYELELTISEDQILYLNIDDLHFCRDGSSAIPELFGIRCPAFEFKIIDPTTGQERWYFVSEDADPLENSEDLKLKCANRVLAKYNLGSMGMFSDFEDYLEDELYGCEAEEFEYESDKLACEAFERYVDEAGGDVDRVIERIQHLIDIEIQKESGLPHYGEYLDMNSDVEWIGDSTDLSRFASRLGYKVLWCSGWISSGDEIVIVDDSIYDNGLTIVDDCSI